MTSKIVLGGESTTKGLARMNKFSARLGAVVVFQCSSNDIKAKCTRKQDGHIRELRNGLSVDTSEVGHYDLITFARGQGSLLVTLTAQRDEDIAPTNPVRQSGKGSIVFEYEVFS